MRATLGVVVGAVIATLCGTAGASPDVDTEHAPTALVVVVDRSMAADKLDAVNQALVEGLAGLGPRDQLAVVEFGETAKVRAKLQKVKTGKAIAAKLTGFKPADRANFTAGLRAAASVLETSKLASRRVLMITGDDCVLGVKSAVGKLRSAGITVSAIGYQSLNQTTVELYASAGGGQSYIVDDPAELAPILAAEAGTVLVEAPDAVAIVFVVDSSGSTDGVVLDAEKELVRVAIENLVDTDLVGVVAVDSEARVVARLQRATNRLRLTSAVAKIKPSGGTDIQPGLKEAFAMLQQVSAKAKYVYVLSDGETPAGGLIDLVKEMRASRIVVSSIGMPGAEDSLMKQIAQAGGGRFLSSEPTELPRSIAAALDRAPP